MKKSKFYIFLLSILLVSCDPSLVHDLYITNSTSEKIKVYSNSWSDDVDSIYIDKINGSDYYLFIIDANSQKCISSNVGIGMVKELDNCLEYFYEPEFWFDSADYQVTKDINDPANWEMVIVEEFKHGGGGIVECYFKLTDNDITQ